MLIIVGLYLTVKLVKGILAFPSCPEEAEALRKVCDH